MRRDAPICALALQAVRGGAVGGGAAVDGQVQHEQQLLQQRQARVLQTPFTSSTHNLTQAFRDTPGVRRHVL